MKQFFYLYFLSISQAVCSAPNCGVTLTVFPCSYFCVIVAVDNTRSFVWFGLENIQIETILKGGKFDFFNNNERNDKSDIWSRENP